LRSASRARARFIGETSTVFSTGAGVRPLRRRCRRAPFCVSSFSAARSNSSASSRNSAAMRRTFMRRPRRQIPQRERTDAVCEQPGLRLPGPCAHPYGRPLPGVVARRHLFGNRPAPPPGREVDDWRAHARDAGEFLVSTGCCEGSDARTAAGAWEGGWARSRAAARLVSAWRLCPTQWAPARTTRCRRRRWAHRPCPKRRNRRAAPGTRTDQARGRTT